MLARILVRAIVACGLLFSLAAIGALWAFGQYPYAGKLAALCIIVGAAAPRCAVLLVLAALPLFGNKPATSQLSYLLLVQSAVMVGIAGRLCVSRRREEAAPAVILLGMLYVLVSALSLSSLNLQSLSSLAYSHVATMQPRVMLAGVFRFLTQSEASEGYPILSVCLTTHAAAFGLLILALGRVEWKRSRFSADHFPLYLSAAVLSGFVISVLAGLLDYYGVLHLGELRALDPTANPGGVQFRLQSFFGHSGWFAEYLTLSVPFVLVLLALPVRYGIRVALVLAVLLLGEWALILTFQRGGWVSYPITLCAVWGAIYVGRKLERGEHDVAGAIRASAVKVAVSLPLTIALSFLFIFGLSRLGVNSPTDGAGLNSYIERFQDIQKASDRTEFMRAGWLIGSLHPILGAGSESFFTAYEREFVDPAGRFAGRIDLPLHGSAHNVYFQTFAGKGAVGLGMLLLILYYLAVPPARAVVKDHERSFQQRLVLLCSVCFSSAFVVYGMVQEIFYVQALQLLFFAVLSGVALIPGAHGVLAPRQMRGLAVAIGIAFVAHLGWEQWHASGLPAAFGCYGEERDEAGKAFRWCSPLAGEAVPIEWEGGQRVVRLTIRLQSRFHNPYGMVFEVLSAGEQMAKLAVVKVGEPVSYTLPLSDSVANRVYTDGSGRELVFLTLRSDTWFVPVVLDPLTADTRLLSYRYYPL